MDNIPIKVLLIDDDEDDYVATRDMLKGRAQRRFKLDWAASFELALQAMAHNEHDVYLIDYRLGRHNGLDLVREAQATGCCRGPVILLTAYENDETDLEAMAAGAADYLIKGQFGAALLERSIRYAIARTETLEALRESEERYALAMHGAQDGLWDWNLKSDKVFYSARWKTMLGCDECEVGASPEEWFKRVHPEDLEQFKAALGAYLEGKRRTTSTSTACGTKMAAIAGF